MKEKKKGNIIGILIVMAIIIFGVIYGGITLTKNWGKSKETISKENATGKLKKICKDININEVEPRKAPIDLGIKDVKDTIPNIDKYPAKVENTTDSYIEIFSTGEKAGNGKDGWLIDVANNFNESKFEINGKIISVKVREIASGLGMDYIISEKYLPDAYSPSNELWGEMIKANGKTIELCDDRMVGNVAGILISKEKYDELIKKYGAINLKNITQAVANGEINMGYTNPFASATGLNFLVSTLATFDSSNPLSEKAIDGFNEFQNNIPLIAYTTLQLRNSAESGILDGFIMEYQTYINSPELKTDYIFTPFGYRHDSPLYSVGNLSNEKKEILNKFIEFYKQDKYQELAVKDGFNALEDYKCEIENLDGNTILQAQKLWKENKNGDKPIVAVFVADVSGSMEGEPLNELKKSLLNGSRYIGEENSIGLVTYSNDVNINLPIERFDLNQRSLFTGAVQDMDASGGTATFDAIAVAVQMLLDEKEKNPDAKLMLFVLSDGETNIGHSLDDLREILESVKIPVHTIGYNANIEALENISRINEATSINADSDDVIYKLGSLFNAEM
ncbi:VWA domain-containing protein [uncultured Clostridium sp.]|uniref:vWA domain-containing protein n=1 Tax=uncultured Clostridium sp. TaxID=59620 RepID=UPI002670978C|nr:VWA domain-containing protein [uncultured Clostridium sp.]